MFKRRRGVVVKCALLVAAFWIGFAIYVVSFERSADDSQLESSARRSVRENRRPLTGNHAATPPAPGFEESRFLNGQEDERERRDRELQERVRRDQTKLQELLDGRKTVPVIAASAANLTQYDPQTANLIRLGLIVPKWGIHEEFPEHLGAPGKGHVICF